MIYLIIAALAVTLAIALKRLRDLNAVIHQVRQSVIERKTLVQGESFSAANAGSGDELRKAANDLIADFVRLQQARSGQLTQLEAALGNLQEAVLIVGSDNRILFANNALDNMFPRVGNALGQRLEIVLHSVDFLGYVQAVRERRALPQQEVEFLEKDSAAWLEVTGALIEQAAGDGETWVLFVLHDITKQKRLENIRKDFVANVSHELRTPLSIIKGYVETLVDGHRNLPVEDRDRFLQTILKHTNRLNSLLQDLLALSRLESGNPGLRCEPSDLPALIESLMEDFQRRAASTGHQVAVAIDPGITRIMIDPLKISQVWENLVDNAFKYTPKGSRIEMAARPRDGGIECSVSDNGPGIPKDDVPHLFERFYRVDKGRSRETGGTGLGLSIVKHIVHLHGGRVWVESEQGRGSSFFFFLPGASGASPAAGPEPGPGEG